MKRILFILLLISQISFGQGLSDAMNISQTKIGGSARFQSMAGAFTALGGELSAVQVNPASGAVFLNGQASISYGGSFIDNSARFYDGGGTVNGDYYNVNQLGAIFIIDNHDYASPIRRFAIGVNYNRTNNFYDDLSFSGTNNTELEITAGNDLYYKGSSSLATSFALAANGYTPDNLRGAEFLAFNTYLIDINDPGSKYYDNRYPAFSDDHPVYVFSGAPLDRNELNNNTQDYNMSKTGYSGQYTFSGSMDIGDKFYIGISYDRSTIFTETLTTIKESNYAKSSDLSDFSYSSYVNTSGTGNGFSVGAIFRASEMLRFGVSYHSPTWYNLTDEYNYSMRTTFKTANDERNRTYSSKTDFKYFNYEVTTPYKIDAGMAIVLGKQGLISADYQYIGYSGVKLGPDRDFEDENRNIENSISSTHNIRIGTEWKVSFVRLRGGYSYSQSPYNNENFQSNTQSFSAGAGVNFKEWSLDLGYQRFFNNYEYYIYEVDLVDAARIDRNESNIVATLRINI